jgi:4-amino-4-deoxy-L-arabinose transferase-like glycosyltransferase
VALSFLGFMRILFLGGRSGADYASAYLGAGLAALAKGAPGLLPVAFAWAFAWWRRRQGTSPRALVHVPAMLGGLLLAGGWPLAMLALHGGEFVRGLAADQVGNRLEGSRWYLNWLYFPATCAEFLLPWYLPLLALAFRDRPALAEGWRRHRESFLFAAGWAAVLLAVLLPSNLYRSRYVLPAMPLLAVLLAGWLSAVDREELLARCWKIVGLVVAGAGALGGAGLVLLGRELDPRFGLGGLLLALLAAGLVPAALRARAARPYLIAGFLLAAGTVNSLCLQVYMKASPGPEIAAVLKRSAPARPEVAVVGTVLPKFRSHVRMCMGGKVDFVERDAAAVKALAPKVLLFTAEERARLDLAGYRVTEAGESYNSFRLGRYLQARWRGRGPAYLEKCRARYFVAIRAG